MICPNCNNEMHSNHIICPECQYIPTLKEVMENYGTDVSFPLMDQEFTVSSKRNVHTQLRKKFDALADQAVFKFRGYLSQLSNLEELIGSGQDMFLLSLEDALNEVSRDAISVGCYDLDSDTIVMECIDGDYFDAFGKAFSAYTAAESKINGSLSESSAYRSSRKQYRRRWTSSTYNGTMLDAWGNQFQAGTMNVIEGAGHSVVNFIGNAMDEVKAEENRKAVFKNQQLRTQLIQGVWQSCSNLRRVISNIVSKRCNVSLGGWITDKDVKEAQGVFNNVMKFNLSVDQQREFVYKILNANPYCRDYYIGFLQKFPEYTEQFLSIADYFGMGSFENELESILTEYVKANLGSTKEEAYRCRELVKVQAVRLGLQDGEGKAAYQLIDNQLAKIEKELELALVNYVKENLGSTEEDAYRCRELAKEHAVQLGLDEGSGGSAYQMIEDQLAKLDLEYRTVSGAVLDTREAADAARQDVASHSDILENPPEFIFRADYLAHMEKIKALPIDKNLIAVYCKRYQEQLEAFDKKCKKAARYNYFLQTNNRFWNGDQKDMLIAYAILGVCLFVAIVSLCDAEARAGGFMWLLIAAGYFIYMITARISKNKNEWEEVTRNGQYQYSDIVGETVPAKTASAQSGNSSVRICPHCSKKNQSDNRFCTSCGKDMQQ